MQDITNQILFGKYKVLSLLGTGSFSTVYLSKHQILECSRAIKCLPKDRATDSLLQEAQLLKSLQHPGIPIIYDLEQDENYFYLVEEYVEGEALEDFLLRESYISYDIFWDLSFQLCDIFSYLHTRTPSPILYLDLKPEHIIVCENRIKLIDFNVSTFVSNMGNIFKFYGNRDFSAPELFLGNAPNFLSDIYSIGKLMDYLSNYLNVPLSPSIQQIISKATDVEPGNRFETVEELFSTLKKQKTILHQGLSRKKIAVVGNSPGCGSTHIAISLVSALNYLGYPSLYYEKNQENNLLNISEEFPGIKEKRGLLSYKYFKGFPLFGPGIILPEATDEFQIYHFGTNFTADPYDFDDIVFICSGAFWHWHQANGIKASSLMEHPSLKIICNMGQKQSMQYFARQYSLPVYHYPYDKDPFSVSATKADFVSKLLNLKRRKSLFFRFLKKVFPGNC